MRKAWYDKNWLIIFIICVIITYNYSDTCQLSTAHWSDDEDDDFGFLHAHNFNLSNLNRKL